MTYRPNRFILWEHKWIYPFVLRNHQLHIENDFKGIRTLELSHEQETELVEAAKHEHENAESPLWNGG